MVSNRHSIIRLPKLNHQALNGLLQLHSEIVPKTLSIGYEMTITDYALLVQPLNGYARFNGIIAKAEIEQTVQPLQ